jgi:hydroxymethylbilane synthase
VTPLAVLDSPDGIFTRAVEAELLAGRADVAVHSLKDLPTLLDPALVLAAFPPRADARDALVSRGGESFDELPPGAVLGTSSPRRAAQVLAQRPDLRVVSVRGNVETRLAKLRNGQVDALLLAAAGLERLGLLEAAAELLSIERFTPAVGQGALALQCRADDPETRALLAAIDDPPTRSAVTAERAFLRALGGGCRLPIAAFGRVQGERLRLRGSIVTTDGRTSYADETEGPVDAPEPLGERLAERLRASAGSDLPT